MFRRIGMLVVGLVFVIALIPFSAQGTDHLSKKGESTEPDWATKIRISETYGKLPLHFEANQGQVDERVRFLSRGSGYNLLLTFNEAVLTLSRRENDDNRNRATERNSTYSGVESLIQTGTLWMRWEGANEDSKVEGVEGLEGKSHYFIGNDPEKWRRNISLYRKVRYRDLYPGVDLIYYGNQRQLEYDLIVMPEGDPNAIRLAIEGAEEVRVNEGGDLVVRISGGEVIQHKPLIYQETEGKREIIRGGYVVDPLGKEDEKGKVRISFKIDHFDREKPLIIDPYLVYSTYLGGWSTDLAYAIAVDDSGSAYITGGTLSPDFPTINPIQGLNGNADAFITKLDPSGTALVYSTYIGGANSNATNDSGKGIAVDSSGSAYITGSTSSTDFPTVNPIQAVYGGGITDGFVTKLDSSGSALVYSTYLGGDGENDYGSGIVVDSSGNAYITGLTESTNFPTSLNAFQPLNGGDADAFVTKLDSSGALVYSTYLGGVDWDGGLAIAVDSSGNAYVTGETYSLNFPTKNPIQASLRGLYADAFVTKLNPSGTALVYSTFLGGSYGPVYDIDYGNGIAVDDSGSAYVVGSTWCTNFPTVNPIQASNAGVRDVFVAKLNPPGTALVYSTYLGGSNDDNGNGIAVDSTGSAYITGATNSTDFPTINAIQPSIGGNTDAFVTKLNPSGSALVYSTYLGGNGSDNGWGIAADSSGAAYVAGATSSTNFPTVNPIQASNAGGNDAFVTKIDSGIPTLSVTPADGLTSSGIQGGPFTLSSKSYTLQNTGGSSINWTASKLQTWTTLSLTSGTLGAGASTTVTVSINSGANSLTPGSYSDTVRFTNTTDGKGTTAKEISLTVIPQGALSVTPADGLTSSGNQGGPFTPSSRAYTLQNTGGSSIDWTASKLQTWTTLPSTHGTLGAGATVTVTVSINSGANSLTPGTYSDTVSFTNTTNGNGNTTRPVSLRVIGPGALSVTPADGLTSSGTQGGPFTPSSKGYTLQNIGNSSIDWTASTGQSWDTLSSVGGTLGAGATTTVTVSINSGANSLTSGTYSDTVSFTNTTNGNGNTTRPVSLTVNAPGALSVTPADGLTSSGPQGGPFTPSSKDYTLQNTGGSSINWTASVGPTWITLTPTSGTLSAGASTTVTVSINNRAIGFAAGSYSGTVSFTNTTNGNGNTTRPVSLTVIVPGILSVNQTGGLTSLGTQGGPFTPSSMDYTLQNGGGTSIDWTASKGQTWVTLSSAGGTLGAGASTTVTVSINSGANSLFPGSYSDTVSFTNTTNGLGNTTRPVSLTVIAPGALSVTPADGLTSSGIQGGPFTPSSKAYTLQNTGGRAINWAATKLQAWTTLTPTSGVLAAGGSTTVWVSINSGANSLTPGSYSDTVSFTNTDNGNGNTTRPVSLTVNATPGVLSVTPADGLTSSGIQGGPFTPSSKAYTLQNTGGSSIDWTASKLQTWTTLSSASGTLNAGASTTLTVSLNSGANSLSPGSYSDTVSFTNTTNGNGNTTRPVSVTVNVPIQTHTVTTSPSGLHVVVDGTTYTAPHSFTWEVVSSHSLMAPSPQSGASGVRYVYGTWSDGGGQSHVITAPSSPTTYTASFTTQYTLTTMVNPAGGGTINPAGTNWYDSGQHLSISANANPGYTFKSWSGDLTETTNPTAIAMTGPKSVTGNFCAIPGTPFSPTPSDGANGISTLPTLSWAATLNTDSYEVYFGTTSPPTIRVATPTTPSYSPSPALSYRTTYYWQVVAKNGCGNSTPGPVWRFTTCSLPSTPSSPTPSNGYLDAPINPTLSWTASDATFYDVYFGETNPPGFLTTTATPTCDPGSLLYGTTYYWKVVAKNACGEIAGPLWSFKTCSFRVTPEAGTLGTELTIEGSGFGKSKGKVLIGGLALKIVEWTDTKIRGSLRKVPPAGVASDVVVQPKVPKGTSITEKGAFTVRGPEITSAPASGVPGSKTPLTIKGNFFTTKKGKVTLERGRAVKSCKVGTWTMDTITFLVPSKMTAATDYTLRVSNSLGSDTSPFAVTGP